MKTKKEIIQLLERKKTNLIQLKNSYYNFTDEDTDNYYDFTDEEKSKAIKVEEILIDDLEDILKYYNESHSSVYLVNSRLNTLNKIGADKIRIRLIEWILK